ncbi:MAG: tyrosine-type recombinase/integrase [Bacillota bacterium]
MPRIKRKLDFEVLLNRFLNSKKSDGCASRTISDYEFHARKFWKWVQEECEGLSFQDVSKDIVREHINYLRFDKVKWDNHPYHKPQGSGLSAATINLRIRNLKVFFNWLAGEGYVENSLMQGMKQHKIDDDVINSLTEDEVLKLIKQPNLNTYTGYRDYVLMLFILDTGIRIGEALSLSDNDFCKTSIIVPSNISKTRKAREIPLSKTVSLEIEQLIKEKFKNWDTHKIFTTYSGKPLTPSGFNHRLSKYADKAGITRRIYPYLLRHTFALLYLKLKHGDAFSLQRILGHSSLNTTRKYVHMSNIDLKEMHNIYSPIESLISKEKRKIYR